MDSRQLLLAGGFAVWTTLAPLVCPVHAQGSVQRELIALERELSAAFLHKDAARLAAALADDYLVTYGDGSVGNKRSEIAALGSTAETITTSTLDEFTVHDYGDFAIVNYRVTATGTRKGKPLNAQFRADRHSVFR